MTNDLASIMIALGAAWTILIVGKATRLELKKDRAWSKSDFWWTPLAKAFAVTLTALPGIAMVIMGARL